MPINAQCPGCGQMLSVGDEFAGAQGKCPTCGNLVTFHAAGAAAPPLAAAPPPASYPPPYEAADQGAAHSYAAADQGAPRSYAPPGPPRDNTELFTLLGLGGAAFSLLLLIVAPLLTWLSIFSLSVSGVHFGDVRIVFCLALALGGLVGWSFKARQLVPLSMVIAGAFGTFCFLFTLTWLSPGGAGVILGLLGAMGVMGSCIWTAIRFPLLLDAPVAAAQPAFIRTFGALLGTQTLALVLGVFYWLIRAMSGVIPVGS